MTGGANNDIFRFAATSHSVVGVNADVITDFDDFGDDRIDVSALFGPAMTYRHNLAFTAAGQVRINDIAGRRRAGRGQHRRHARRRLRDQADRHHARQHDGERFLPVDGQGEGRGQSHMMDRSAHDPLPLVGRDRG